MTPLSAWEGTIRGQPAPGARVERSRTTTADDIVAFTAITGDRNPLHYDRALAEASRFGKLVVQGGITSGLLNAIVAEDLPGPGTVFLAVEWRFLKPVGIGEPLIARVEVTSVRDDKPIATLRCEIVDGSGDPVLAGTATTYTLALQAA